MIRFAELETGLVWPLTSCLTCLCLSFHTCKAAIVIVLTLRVTVRVNNAWKACSPVSANSESESHCRVWLFATPWTIQSMEFSSPWNGYPFHSLGYLPNPGIEPRSPSRCRQILYQLDHQGSPIILEWVAYPFCRVFPTQELNRVLLPCRRILYQLSYQGSPEREREREIIIYNWFVERSEPVRNTQEVAWSSSNPGLLSNEFFAIFLLCPLTTSQQASSLQHAQQFVCFFLWLCWVFITVPSCVKWGLLCSARASHCDGFSCEKALGHMGLSSCSRKAQ